MFLMFFYTIFVGIFFSLGLWSLEEEKYFNAILNFVLCWLNVVLSKESCKIHRLKRALKVNQKYMEEKKDE